MHKTKDIWLSRSQEDEENVDHLYIAFPFQISNNESFIIKINSIHWMHSNEYYYPNPTHAYAIMS